MSNLEWVFAYGSNMNLDDLRRWLGEHGHRACSIERFAPAVLADYQLVWNYFSGRRNGGAANIEVARGARLPGLALYVDAATFAAIDEKEGHPHWYSRGTTPLACQLLDGTAIEAWVYIARPEHCTTVPQWPTREYRDLLVSAAIMHGLPAEHVAALQQVTVR